MSGIVQFGEGRRRQRRKFVSLVAKVSAVAFCVTIVVGAGWNHLASAWQWATTAGPVNASEVSAVVNDATILQLNHKAKPPERRVVDAFPACTGSKRVTCVVDGDTFWLDGEKVRIADIDTPEIGEAKCSSERALGEKAKKRLQVLLSAGPFQMQRLPDRDTDKYGRSLRILVRNAESIGDRLVAEGLARTWSGRREPWCST
ncbi:thermonuclease family protein [Shinella sp. BE166]|uniref:thermonuclease family protein n=1 Tax=unclassified Shinella TaxID=2643062 RepID=UPI003EBDFE9B